MMQKFGQVFPNVCLRWSSKRSNNPIVSPYRWEIENIHFPIDSAWKHGNTTKITQNDSANPRLERNRSFAQFPTYHPRATAAGNHGSRSWQGPCPSLGVVVGCTTPAEDGSLIQGMVPQFYENVGNLQGIRT